MMNESEDIAPMDEFQGGNIYLYTAGDFYKNTWKRYIKHHNASALLDHHPTFFAHKEMVAAAFVANYLAADIRAVKQPLMAQVALAEIAAAEKLIMSREMSRFLKGQIKLKEFLGSREFFSEVYMPCGGLSAVSDIPSLSDLQQMISSRSNWIWQLYQISKIMHHLALLDNKVGGNSKIRPSFDRCCDIFIRSHRVQEFSGGRLAKKQLNTAWQRYKSVIAMIYAFANTEATGKFENLLECFLSANFNHRYIAQLSGIRAAIGRSQYFCTVVLLKHADREIYQSNFIEGLRCDPIPLSPPTLNENVLANIESALTGT